MFSNYVYSLIRTAVPYIVGFVLAIPGANWLASALGVDTPSAQRTLTAATTFVLGFIYYAIVRLLEERWPKLGALLGVVKAPTYGAQAQSGGTQKTLAPAGAGLNPPA